MKLKKQITILGFIIITIPILCTLFIGINNYIHSAQRYIIRGRNPKGTHLAYGQEIKKLKSKELKNNLRDFHGDIDFVLLDAHGIVLISTFEEFPKDYKIKHYELADFISTSCEKYFYQITRYSGEDEFYFLLTRINHQSIAESPKNFYIPLLVFIAALVTISVCVLFHISRNLFNSLFRLQKQMEQIADGKLDIEVDIRPFGKKNELTSIADSLERMRISLKDIQNRKNKLIMGISHDLRTPVAVIKGYTEALSDGVITEPEEKAKTYELIKSKADKLGGMINTLIDFVKLDNNEFRQTLVSQSITDLIKSFAKDAQNTVSVFKRTLEINLNLPNNISVPFDEQLVIRVFENLLSNALRYTNEGDRIEIISYEDKKESCVIFELHDSGIGMEQKDLSNIFDLFYRATNSRREEGLGIGLSVVKNIIETHGWSIKVDSEKNKGSCFTIIIPY